MRRFASKYRSGLTALMALSCVCAFDRTALSASPDPVSGRTTGSESADVYEGYSTAVSTTANTCPRPGPVEVGIRDGRVRLVWRDGQVFEAPVSPGGTFAATLKPAGQSDKHMTLNPTLSGYLDSNTLVADYGTRWCHYRLEAAAMTANQATTQHAAGDPQK